MKTHIAFVEIAEFIGPFLLEGIFIPSFVSLSSAMNAKQTALEPVLHLLLRDDIISWYKLSLNVTLITSVCHAWLHHDYQKNPVVAISCHNQVKIVDGEKVISHSIQGWQLWFELRMTLLIGRSCQTSKSLTLFRLLSLYLP